MCQIGSSEEKMSPYDEQRRPQPIEELINDNTDIKYLVDLYTATLHLR